MSRFIKVLTDLENSGRAFFYRHAGPKGPEEVSIAKKTRCAGDNLVNRVNLVNPDSDNKGLAGDR